MADPVTPDPIRAAIEQLRASRAALPNWAKRTGWSNHVGFVNASGGEPVADARPSYTADTAGIAAHIALTAAPDVTEAQANLLEALADTDLLDALDAGEIDRDEIRRIQSAAEALATAITRRDS